MVCVSEKAFTKPDYIYKPETITEGLNLSALDNNFISDFIFEVCKDCFKMPSLPQGAFAAHKIREKHQHIALCKAENCREENPPRYDMKKRLMQLSPTKYNEKLMNSIWGRYNRNSPHNFKKNNAANLGGVTQQPMAVAADLANPNVTTHHDNQLIRAAIAASGFGVVTSPHDHSHVAEEAHNFQKHHHQHQRHRSPSHHHHHHKEGHSEHGPLGDHGHTHKHGHHGNFHKHGHEHEMEPDHSHYEQHWCFSVI